jgi:hypothetical protein
MFLIRFGTVRYGTVRYGTVRYGTVRYGTLEVENWLFKVGFLFQTGTELKLK